MTGLGDGRCSYGADGAYGSTKLAAQDSIYRVRSGDYRILYTVDQRKVVVTVVKVGDRKDVYRKL